MDRMYSVLNVKTVEDDKRIIAGVATSPTPDRVGDIIEPLGIKFTNPLPLLWMHRSAEPVGTVILKKPTKDGVDFEARLPKPEQIKSESLRARVDEAWDAIKLGLVKGVSIGFRDLESSFMKDGGIRFIESEVLELSLVTIPANADATIQQIKSIDAATLAATGNTANGNERANPPGDTGRRKPISFAPKDAAKVKTFGEMIEALESKRTANEAALAAIQNKVNGESRTKDEKEREEFDNLKSEIDSIDVELKDLRELDRINKSKAVVVNGQDTKAATESRSPDAHRTPAMSIQVRPNLPKGIGFARYALAKARSIYAQRSPYDIAREQKGWDNTPEVALALSVDVEPMLKAAVGVGTTTDATWAAPLVAYNVLASEFVEYLRPLTIIGRIPGLRRVPFNIQMPRETSPTSVGWVGENAPKPVSAAAFDTITMRWAKAAGIVVMTEELVRFSNPSAEAVIRDDLASSMTQFLDRQFVDPTVAAVTNVSPASITNGVTAVTATGTTAAAFRTDVRTMLNTMLVNNLAIGSGVWIMTQQQAMSLSLMVSSLAQPLFPNITNTGGTLLGFPVVASENIPGTGGSPSDGYPLIFAIPSEIFLADDGQTIIDASREASVQLDTAPDSPPSASTTMVSFWQMNFVGLRAERWINWQKRRSTAVGYIQNAKYAE